MPSKPLLLLSAAFLLGLPLVAEAQQPPRTRPAPAISLGGRYLAARVAEQDHDYEKGSDQFDMALAQAPNDPELIYGAFRMRLYAGRFDSAAQIAPSVLATKPGDGFANLVLMIQHIKRGDMRAAEQQFGRIGAENQFGPLRDHVAAWLKAGQKDFTGARELMTKIRTAAGPSAKEVPPILDAQIDEMAGDRAAAEEKYRRALQLDPTGLRTTLVVGEALRRLGQADDARNLFKAYGEKNVDQVVMDGLTAPNAPASKPPTAASGISDILFDIGGALSADPRNQRTDLSLIFLLMSVELKPDQDFAWLTLSGLYEQFQTPAKAVAALGKVTPTSPLSWQSRLRMAALDAQEDRLDSAITRLRALVAEKPARIDAALTLADLLRSKERYADAVAAYDVAVSRLPKAEERHWVVYFGRGIVLERVKQWLKAEADMKTALELSPDQPYLLNYLGYSWVDQGVNLEAGMKMLKRATELRPDDGAISDSVGWAYYRIGQFDTAVEWLERASEQKGDDATIVEHLGDTYWHVGRRREARFQWERALNQKPDKDRLPIIKDKIANGLNATNDKPTVYEKPADKKQGG